ncbi:MAG TPA: polysaccharide pyruvyl transferase family protein [Patescibacteria group bacterium]|nr:polysaccharide pyruvyl transferase family protein [Patescibacteria group bacterium]
MKEVKVCYTEAHNLGDVLNKLIIENVMEYCVINSSRFRCQTTGIGSGLARFFVPESRFKHSPKGILSMVVGKMAPSLQVWSAGFLSYPTEKEYSLRRNVNVSSVRGEITRKRLESILNKKLDVPTGDGGLLASCLIKNPIKKKYQIGVIPHMKEKEEMRFKELLNQYDKSVLIDITGEAMSVLQTISECEFILSSGLHGLIVADSFGIPNKRLIYTNRLSGDGYKFDDYYSSFNVSPDPFNLNEGEYPTINSIIDDYMILKNQVEQKKKEIVKCFSQYIG